MYTYSLFNPASHLPTLHLPFELNQKMAVDVPPIYHEGLDREMKEFLPFSLVVQHSSSFKEGQDGQGERSHF